METVLYTQDFGDLVLFETNKTATKGNGTLKQCIDFILEGCAYTCAFFKNIINEDRSSSVNGLNICLCNYKQSVHLQASRSDGNDHNRSGSNFFMAEKSANFNFFVIDKEGIYI